MKASGAPCWYCRKLNDQLGRAFGVAVEPQPGDITICIGCGTFGILLNDGRSREPTIAESEEILRNSQAMRARASWRAFNARRLQS